MLRIIPGFLPLLCAFAAELPTAPPAPKPDDRFKADILVIVAHPDDETMVTGYLAKAVLDDHRRVAVIFGTRGDGGGNAQGFEQAAALGAEREIEGRRALAHFGIMNVWFLGGPDTPGQDVLRSLETWNHGAALAQTVRLVRLTRPSVILTWLPCYVAGENHGDHQAAGVIATEAFDLAGDPTVFPEQISAPRDHFNISNLTEGLHPWQPQKLYYFSDASHTEFLDGKGPRYSTMETSPSRKQPYYRLAAEEMTFHLTQSDTGQFATRALAGGDFKYFQEPVRLVFGKTVVKSSPTGDIFEGVSAVPVPFASIPGYHPVTESGARIELGGPWAFYQRFWQAHNIEHLANLVPPEVEIGQGAYLHIPVLIHNRGAQAQEVELTAAAPEGWKVVSGNARYPVDPRDIYPAMLILTAPSNAAKGWNQVTILANSGGREVGHIPVRVRIGAAGLPQ